MILMKEHESDAALRQLARIPASSPLAEGAKLSKFYIYLYDKNDNAGAKKVLDELSKGDLAGTYELDRAMLDYGSVVSAGGSGKPQANFEQDTLSESADLVLEQNAPNPFNPSTVIGFGLPKPAFVSLKIYDMLGREVATLVNEQKNKGMYRVSWDATRFASGVYFARIDAAGKTAVRKLLLVK